MKYLVFGSLNIDRTYSVSHFVSAGETLAAAKMELFCGGKGFNQAVALSRAGKKVYFAGAVGSDGGMLMDALKAEGIDDLYVKRTSGASGHAVIQVDPKGQNCILVLSGANGEITEGDIDAVLSHFEKGDLVVVQNEISNVAYVLQRASELGMIIAFNPSPIDDRILSMDLNGVDYLLINETEGQRISGCISPRETVRTLQERYPNMKIVLTLGERGAMYCGADGRTCSCGIYPETAVDTTAAGDTFTGYFLAEIMDSEDAEKALKTAAVASGIAISRKGAAPSIPCRAEVMQQDHSRITAFRG